MVFPIRKNYLQTIFKCLILILLFLLTYIFLSQIASASILYTNEEIEHSIQQIFKDRNNAIIDRDLKLIESIYDTNTKYGTWAYEYEKKKLNYICNWEEKQGIKFTEINPKIIIRNIKRNEDKLSVNLICSTEYKYVYIDKPEETNVSKIGTYHSLKLIDKNGTWIITKEWYNDPFGDYLNLNNIKTESIRKYILSQNYRDVSNIGSRRLNTVEYANKYCGAASEEKYDYKYNTKYRDYNPKGGDCANFASQILFEGAKFKKNPIWNYDHKDATHAWLNADGFKNYMLLSGRASVISYGNYEKVYKLSYKLLPGDFIAYEKKGDITHISMVTGADSRGYSLVSCHNSDRNKVPWDLGWSDKNIRFWLIHVNY